MKIIEAINSLISTVALVYFAYGTWRIDRTLTKVEQHLASIKETLDSNLPPI